METAPAIASSRFVRSPFLIVLALAASCNDGGLSPAAEGKPDASMATVEMSLPDEDMTVQADLAVDPCKDGVTDVDESDVDCGGGSCAGCPLGKRCTSARDCASGLCKAGTCRSATPCVDGVRDEQETDLDCGGPICRYCATNQKCRDDADCGANLVCTFGVCRVPPALRLAWKDPVGYPTGKLPSGLGAGDLDGDGKVDLLVANRNDSTVGAYLGRGDGTFVAPRLSPTGDKPFNLLVADFDGDGRLDHVVGAAQTANVWMGKGLGDGTFAAGVVSTVVTDYGDWAAGDIDGDGLPDIAAGGTLHIGVMRNVGMGNFGQTQIVPTRNMNGGPSNAVMGDLDRDGYADVVNLYQKEAAFARARGNGTFADSTALHAAVSAGSAAIFDFDRDGLPDIVTSGVDLFRGGAKLTFAAPKGFPSGTSYLVKVADFDRDGHADLVLTPGQANGTLTIVPGAAGPSFGQAITLFTPAVAAGWIAVADFNRDGKPDIAFVDYMGNQLYVLLNDSQ